jgi:5'-3' exoribonuclease 1
MGIPSYFSHIVKSHRNIIKQFNKSTFKVNNLYLDSNSIVYDAIHNMNSQSNQQPTNKPVKKEEFEYKLITDVCKKIEEYIELINPSHSILIAFDGVAPIAKLEQQRNRRYKSWFQNELLKSINSNQSDSSNNQTDWDTCNITPGTSFMKELGDRINHYFKYSKYNKKIKNLIVSSSNIKGEGEHKICEYIREHPEFHRDTKTVIYGLDADLIMLALNHLHISSNIYLFRETPHYIVNIDNTLNPNELYVIDIPVLGEIIKNKMSNELIENINTNVNTANTNLVFDYILICFILGNDFLPHFPSINIRTSGIDILMNTYKHVFSIKLNNTECKINLTDGKKIIWKNFRRFISVLAEKELENFQCEMKIRDKWERNMKYGLLYSNDPLDKLNRIPIKYRELEKYINPGEDGWQNRYYKTLFDIDIENDINHLAEERKREICLNYLEGLEWTIKYYTSGCCNWRWKYKYSYAPLLEDLIKYTPYFDSEFIDSSPHHGTMAINEYTQLCYVLPKHSMNLLPDKLHKGLLEHYGELYQDNYDFKWAFCKYFWEAHAIMPHIDINNLEELVSNTMKK